MFRITEEFQVHENSTDWEEDFKGSTTIDEFSELFDSLAVKITFFILFIIYETFNNAFYVVVYMFERFGSTGCGVSIIALKEIFLRIWMFIYQSKNYLEKTNK